MCRAVLDAGNTEGKDHVPTAHGAGLLMRKQAVHQGYVYSVTAVNVETEQRVETKMKNTVLGSQLLIEPHPVLTPSFRSPAYETKGTNH